MVLINRGLGNWVKYYKWGVRTNERAFFYFDPNEKYVSKFTFVRTKLQFMESEKSTEAI